MLRQLTDLEERIRKGPIKIRVVENNEASFTKDLDEAKQKLTDLQMASKAKNMQLGEREAKIESLEKKLNECDSNKEFQLLKDRIAADVQANSVLQDEILEQLERIDVLSAEADKAKSNLATAQNETKSIRDKVELELKELEAEKARISGELAEAEKKLPEDVAGYYRRLVTAKGENALGETNTEICGNCNQTLTTQQASDLLMKKLMLCKGCGCLMYLPAGHIVDR
jgi:predicted  nucleic acid-binding Zn-ribbon protein